MPPTAPRRPRSSVADALHIFTNGLIKGLADAGLVPVVLDSNPDDGKPPEGSDFILTSELEQLEVNKRFSAEQTIHGQYFTMRAVVRVKYQLKNREGAMLYSDEVTGIESEPPNPVGAEVFLPLETDPAESLSVASLAPSACSCCNPTFATPCRCAPSRRLCCRRRLPNRRIRRNVRRVAANGSNCGS